MKKVALILIAVLTIIGATAGIVTLFNATGMFDMNGQFIKDEAKEKDTLTFMEIAERPDFYEMVNEPDKYLDKALKFYGVVQDVELHSDKSKTFTIKVLLNNKEKLKFKEAKLGDMKVEVVTHINFEDSNFYRGDEIKIYGELLEVVKDTDKYEISLEGRKFILEIE